MKEFLLVALYFLGCAVLIWLAFMVLAVVLYKSFELLQWVVA